ncbi:hypothetical protein [Veronia pacifica]|uniref:Uncharacterized protein n=1 Tax=Veronia pacifica TaxID=1080227 RepID=A0A1C3ESN4_9GAMM|nr:hypothetical protein [Veronia pacifica]ODA36226.1 hypothetical protein A8L45_01075 [Veronia pacifica]
MHKSYVLWALISLTACGGSESPVSDIPKKSIVQLNPNYRVELGDSTFYPSLTEQTSQVYVPVNQSASFWLRGLSDDIIASHTWSLKKQSDSGSTTDVGVTKLGGKQYEFLPSSPGQYVLESCVDKRNYNPTLPDGFFHCLYINIHAVNPEQIDVVTDKNTAIDIPASKFIDDDGMRFIDVEQPKRGVLLVDKARQTLTYRPFKDFDYLMDDMPAEVQNINVTLTNGTQTVIKTLRLTVSGTASSPACHEGNSRRIEPGAWGDEPTIIEPDECIEMDASNYSPSGRWDTIRSFNDITLFEALLGIDADSQIIRFKYPFYGHFWLSWCEGPNQCESDLWQVKTNLERSSIIEAPKLERMAPEVAEVGTVFAASANVSDGNDSELFYHWTITDISTNSVVLGNMITDSAQLDIALPSKTSDLKISVKAQGASRIVDDYYGNDSISFPERQYLHVRGDRDDAPEVVVKLNGKTYKGSDHKGEIVYFLDAEPGDSLSFDGLNQYLVLLRPLIMLRITLMFVAHHPQKLCEMAPLITP